MRQPKPLLVGAGPDGWRQLEFILADMLMLLPPHLEFLCSSSQIASDTNSPKHHQRTFWHSIAVELLNPKTAIFYIAFLPQFSDPSASLPLWAQLLILGTVVNVMFSSADVLCVMLSSSVVNYFKKTPAGSRIMQRISGTILVGLGINLVFTRQ